MKTLQFTSNVHLSEKFGGIEHGEKIKPDVAKGAIHEIKSDELADHLLDAGLATEIKTEESKPAKKSKVEKTETGAAGVVVALLLFLGLIFSPAAHADDTQGQPATFVTVTNQPAIVLTTASSNIVSWVKLRNDKGLGLSWIFNQSAASTSNATLNVYSSVDGTNISTGTFAALTAASTGTTNVVANTNWSAAQLSGLDSLVIGNIANTTALTTLTNKGIIIRRPN